MHSSDISDLENVTIYFEIKLIGKRKEIHQRTTHVTNMPIDIIMRSKREMCECFAYCHTNAD